MRTIILALFILFASLGSFAQAVLTANVTSLDFGGVAVGGVLGTTPNGPGRGVIVTNTGNAALTISAVQATGDFFVPLSLFPQLPITLNPGELREFGATFVASAAGTRTGTLTFTTTAASSPTIALTGTGLTTDFSIAVEAIPPSFAVPPAVTVTAGQQAGYRVELFGGNQFPSSLVTVTCTGLPTGTSFNVLTEGATNQVSMGPSSGAGLTIGINTTAAMAQNRTRHPLWYAFGMVAAMALVSFKRQKRGLMIVGLLMMAFAIVSCGGGSSQTPPAGPTPAGTFNLVFTATSGTTMHSASATLIVQ